jgi:hypothetical protein
VFQRKVAEVQPRGGDPRCIEEWQGSPSRPVVVRLNADKLGVPLAPISTAAVFLTHQPSWLHGDSTLDRMQMEDTRVRIRISPSIETKSLSRPLAG